MVNQTEIIRALSWKQPFASLMFHGKIETRSYPTNVRGKVLICSSQQAYATIDMLAIAGSTQIKRIDQALSLTAHNYKILPRGYAIAIADLVDCRPMMQDDEDICFIKYSPNLWCWIFDNVEAITPFAYKGKQGWSIVDASIKEKITIKEAA